MGWAGFNCFLATLQKKIFLVGASLTITKNTPTWGNCEIIWIVALCALGSMQIGHRAQLSGGLTAYIAWHIVPWIQYTNNWRQVCQIGEFDFSTTASAMKEGKISWETIFWISLNFTGHGFLESQLKLFVFHLLKHCFYLMVLKILPSIACSCLIYMLLQSEGTTKHPRDGSVRGMPGDWLQIM